MNEIENVHKPETEGAHRLSKGESIGKRERQTKNWIILARAIADTEATIPIDCEGGCAERKEESRGRLFLGIILAEKNRDAVQKKEQRKHRHR
ncbi:hypothetical protein QN277_029028 [Acacia crassicarpa]|uniref:Uncharacterized protein n=1 Tax=Acacia crassicarpa TaxID=499986 RepID=A0AAE1J700_9FABA|nr:hypothetical protein QN277_029028 [Acacia crassicarpa]